jgi:hypothetical protein
VENNKQRAKTNVAVCLPYPAVGTSHTPLPSPEPPAERPSLGAGHNDDDNYNDFTSTTTATTTTMSRIQNNPGNAASPTYTTFSGISNYRQSSSGGSARRLAANAPPVPAVDGRLIAQAHFNELSRYLAEYLAKGASRLAAHVDAAHSRSLRNYQSRPTLDQPRAKSSPGSHASSSRSSRLTSTTSSSDARPRARRPTRVRRTACGLVVSPAHTDRSTVSPRPRRLPPEAQPSAAEARDTTCWALPGPLVRRVL